MMSDGDTTDGAPVLPHLKNRGTLAHSEIRTRINDRANDIWFRLGTTDQGVSS